MKYIDTGENMRVIYGLVSAVLLCSMFSDASLAQQDKVSLPFLMGSKQVLIIGESYGQAESARFFSKTVTEYLNGGGSCRARNILDQQETSTAQ
jgi:hypothetical protein